MPTISPLPRTSPTILNLFVQSAVCAKMYSPIFRAFSIMPSSSRSIVASDSLRAGDNVRLDARVFERPPLSGASHAGLHFIHDQHDSVLAANPLQFLQKEFRRRHVAAFALNRLNNYSRNFRRIKKPLENLVLQRLQNFRATSLRRMPERAAISIRIGNMLHAAQQLAKSLALRGFRGRQRQRTHRPPVKTSIK